MEPAVREAETMHPNFLQVARAHYAQSSLNGAVSSHRFGDSVSFRALKDFLVAAAENAEQLFVGVLDGDIVVSFNANARVPNANPPTPPTSTSRKRRRDPEEEEVEAQIDRIRTNIGGAAEKQQESLEAAQSTVLRLLKTLRGTQSEQCVESWGVSARKAENGDGKTQHPGLILSARLRPGVVMSLATLQRALQPAAFHDGLLTLRQNANFGAPFQLPLTESSAVAESLGARSLALFSSVVTPTKARSALVSPPPTPLRPQNGV